MASKKSRVRIGNAQAFWGDRPGAAADMLAREPELDYLTMDYLAEVSMSILAMQRERDSSAGYARDFIDVIRSLVPYWSAGGKCKLISNAGGLNPRACAEACHEVLVAGDCAHIHVAAVIGDDVLEYLRGSEAGGQENRFANLDTGAPISEVRDRLVTANAYLGAEPILEALASGADIVITGRVADPSLTIGPCVYHFGWNQDDLDRLAGATIAGHLIECGTQVTGGISTDWLEIGDPAHIGFPVAEVAADGSCIVTKPRGTGGRVNSMTVKEQLLYEIGDPDNYVSPDIAVSFLSVSVEDLGSDRVRVSGASGKRRPAGYKVSATYRDGFRSAGTLTVIGRDAAIKARTIGDAAIQGVRDSGYTLRDSVVECLGTGAAVPLVGQATCPTGFGEVVLRVGVESESREAVECFTRELMPFITAGPQGTTGYAEGRPRVHSVFRYWPTLIDRGMINARVESISTSGRSRSISKPLNVTTPPATSFPAIHESEASSLVANSQSHLYDIACARSGDKGTSANVGVIARSGGYWDFLRKWLTAERVAEHFASLHPTHVDRYELPNMQALNFVLHGVLRQSLRTDAQGKALGQALLEMRLPADFNDRSVQ
jgi:hypothetical protein